MNTPRFIEALGITTPAPGDQRQQIEALITGAPLFRRHPTWIGPDGQRQVMGFVAELRDHADYPSRVAALLHRAYLDCRQDCLARYGQAIEAPMIVLLPPVLQRHALGNAFRDAAAKLDFAGVTEVHLVFGGASAALALLGQVGLDDAPGRAYVAAADSLVTPFMLDFLAVQGLLRDRLNPWSPIPAEAAAVLLLSRHGGIAQLRGWTTTQEMQRIADPSRGLLGRALGDAIDAAMDMAGVAPNEVISDAGPERWQAEEVGIIRTERPFLTGESLSWHRILRGVGDLGAATGLVSVAAACVRGTASLILSSDRSGGRTAAIVAPS